MASQRNHRVSAGENMQGKLPCWEKMLGLLIPESSYVRAWAFKVWDALCSPAMARLAKEVVLWELVCMVKFGVLQQESVWRQEVGSVTLRNLWEWWVQSFLSSCVRKDMQGRAICFLYSFGLCLLYFPLWFGVRDRPPAHKVDEMLWDNPTDIIDLESPLKEGALTLLNSYFQKHKTYQNMCQDQQSHSILSNLLLPNCNLFLGNVSSNG